MTKKDYELFANVLYNDGQASDYGDMSFKRVVVLLSGIFKSDNSLFNPDKFERACYEGKPIRKSIKER